MLTDSSREHHFPAIRLIKAVDEIAIDCSIDLRDDVRSGRTQWRCAASCHKGISSHDLVSYQARAMAYLFEFEAIPSLSV
jgi:hypothetical protein